MMVVDKRERPGFKLMDLREFERRWNALPTSDTLFEPIDPDRLKPDELAIRVAETLEETGIVVIRSSAANGAVRDALQQEVGKFFALPDEVAAKTQTRDGQGGITPEYTERPQDQAAFIAALDEANRPFPEQYRRDPKKRLMLGYGPRRPSTHFPRLLASTPILPGFDRLDELKDEWGDSMMVDAKRILAAYARRYQLDPSVFDLSFGAHFVAPTGINLRERPPSTVAAGLHSDMGVLTGHERSMAYFNDDHRLVACGGLVAWTRGGKMFRVVVPEGYRLFQAGMQLEWITDGRVLAGMHQVVVPPSAKALAAQAAAANAQVSRVTSTLFFHYDADRKASVPEVFRTPGKTYEEIYLGKLDDEVLDKIFAPDVD